MLDNLYYEHVCTSTGFRVLIISIVFVRPILYNWLIWRAVKLAFFFQKSIFPVFILASGAVRITSSLCRHIFMRSLIWPWWAFAKKRQIKNHAKLTSYTVYVLKFGILIIFPFLPWLSLNRDYPVVNGERNGEPVENHRLTDNFLTCHSHYSNPGSGEGQRAIVGSTVDHSAIGHARTWFR